MMFETLASSSDRQVAMNKFFPISWAYFNMILDEVF